MNKKPNYNINHLYGKNGLQVAKLKFHRFKNSEIMDACERIFKERTKLKEKLKHD